MNSLSQDSIVPLVDESNQPIAHMKGFYMCTNHHTERYVAYGLPPSYRIFVLNLDSMHIPNSIQEALKVP